MPFDKLSLVLYTRGVSQYPYKHAQVDVDGILWVYLETPGITSLLYVYL